MPRTLLPRRRTAALGLAACLLTAGPRIARAQDDCLRPGEPRMDTSGFVGWQVVRVDQGTGSGGPSFQTFPDHQWDSRFPFGAIVGYYWTTHLKTEIEIAGTVTSRYGTVREVAVPGQSFPGFVWTNHRARDTSPGGRLLYQFGDNAFFHPYAGVGVAAVRTSDRAETPRQVAYVSEGPGPPTQQIVIAEGETSTSRAWDAQPVLLAGFKAYTSARVFVRTEMVWNLPAQGDARVSWRVGAGVDF